VKVSKMLNIGIIGFGFMGRMHYRCWKDTSGADVVAICDANPDVLKNTDKSAGNIEGAEEKIDFDGLQLYTDVKAMLADANLDAVSLTLPTFMHNKFSIMALEAGVHVLCEKPMALEVDQCQQMIAAAKKSGKILQIGHCIRFWPEYAKTKEIVDSGEYGKVITATFKRLGSPPTWGAENWFANDQRSGGVALDLHIHDSDFIQYLFGMPTSVSAFGNPKSGKGLKHITTRYCYDDDKLVTADGSWAMTPSFGFEMSFNIVMEKATIVYDCTREPAFKVCPADGDVFTPQVAKGDGYTLQIEHFAGLINGEKLAQVTTLDQSLDSIRLVNAEVESVRKNSEIEL
jgi:predicted dehydrogenase